MSFQFVDISYYYYYYYIYFILSIITNHRKPFPENSTVLIKTKMKNVEGRKLFMEATMETIDGNILAESTSLFITIAREVENIKA